MGEEYRQVVRGFLRHHMPALADAPIDLTEICLYTVAPDEDFVVDFHPGRPDVIVASPCSGHGFKFSCLIGRVLADLAMKGQSPIVVPAWKCHLTCDIEVEAVDSVTAAEPSGPRTMGRETALVAWAPAVFC